MCPLTTTPHILWFWLEIHSCRHVLQRSCNCDNYMCLNIYFFLFFFLNIIKYKWREKHTQINDYLPLHLNVFFSFSVQQIVSTSSLNILHDYKNSIWNFILFFFHWKERKYHTKNTYLYVICGSYLTEFYKYLNKNNKNYCTQPSDWIYTTAQQQTSCDHMYTIKILYMKSCVCSADRSDENLLLVH